jgi:hypothetical protein
MAVEHLHIIDVNHCVAAQAGEYVHFHGARQCSGNLSVIDDYDDDYAPGLVCDHNLADGGGDLVARLHEVPGNHLDVNGGAVACDHHHVHVPVDCCHLLLRFGEPVLGDLHGHRGGTVVDAIDQYGGFDGHDAGERPGDVVGHSNADVTCSGDLDGCRIAGIELEGPRS